jgi:GAF domain-containing protein
MTGQPMAVSNARDDPRHASRIAEQIGYLPDSLLCVPLVFADEVVGVLELLDKQGAGFFDNADMETLGLFASLAAVAIEQSRTRSNVTSLLLEVPALKEASGQTTAVERRVDDFAASLEHEPRFRRTLELAQLVHQITQAGDEELEACAGILGSFAAYVRARAEPWRALGVPR